MHTNRSAAAALVTGTAAGLLTMALHPTGRDVIQNASAGGHNALNVAVHGMAIVGQALVLAGALGLVARLRTRRDLAVGGYVFFALAAVAIIIAAAASGFLAPSVVHGFGDATGAERQLALNALQYTGAINEAFARTGVILIAFAFVLWSSAILAGREVSRALGIYGFVVGAVLLFGIVTGHLTLGIHGFFFVVIAEGVFLVWAAQQLWRVPGDGTV